MKKVAICAMIMFLSFHCEKNTEPILSPLDFSKLKISYSRTGGWINTSTLVIDSTGFIAALHIGHASDSVLNSTTGTLSENQKREFEMLFSRFSEFDSYYEPSPWYTDGNLHRIVLHYEATYDTVTVYEPENAEIPSDLNSLINKLYSLWESLIYDFIMNASARAE